jgi:hypothetical protein
VRVLYFGTYDRAHPRNSNAIAAMRGAGIEVLERSAPVRGRGLSGLLSVLKAETRLSVPRHADADVVIVGYPGHFDVPRARRVARGRVLVFDAVLSLEHELVAVRRRFPARSTAATLLRVVDSRALRLPDLVVCGTEAEARHLEELGASRTAVVFLGADEDEFSETWTPTYPFSVTHVADLSGSLDVLQQAEPSLEIPLRVVEPGGDVPLGLAVAHAGVLVAGLRPSRAIAPIVFGALATGTPVVTADTDATRELLDDDSALLVAADDPAAVAAAVNRLAADAPLRERIGAAGRALFERRASRRVLGERWRGLLDETLR